MASAGYTTRAHSSGSGLFRQLEDPNVFDAARIEYGTVTWPGGIDIAPEELYENCIPS